MTASQKSLGWVALASFVLYAISNEGGGSGDTRTILGWTWLGSFLLWLAYLLKSEGKDGFSVLIIPAAVFIGTTFPSLGKGVVNLCGYLMQIGVMLGGFVAAAVAAKKAQSYPVLTFCLVLIAWYSGVMGLMTILRHPADE